MEAPPRRARHLMDPANPIRQVNDRALTRVQRTVASVLATTTILHLSAGLIIAAVFVDDEHVAARIGLNVIAGAFAVIAVGVGFAIHGRNPLSLFTRARGGELSRETTTPITPLPPS